MILQESPRTYVKSAAIGVINFMLGWAPAALSLIMILTAYFLPIEKDYERAQAKLASARAM